MVFMKTIYERFQAFEVYRVDLIVSLFIGLEHIVSLSLIIRLFFFECTCAILLDFSLVFQVRVLAEHVLVAHLLSLFQQFLRFGFVSKPLRCLVNFDLPDIVVLSSVSI